MKLLIPLMFLLVACGSDNESVMPPVNPPVVEPPIEEPVVTRYSLQTSWYELEQYFDGVPKYSGVMGTYTAKHSPVAVKCSIGEFAVTSNNRFGGLEIFIVNLQTGMPSLVHKIDGAIDPHQNAAIQCDDERVWIAVSARGNKREGYLLESYDGENWHSKESSFRSYPQLHVVNGELLTLYTNYIVDESQPNGVLRTILSSCNDDVIVSDGLAHYSISHFDGETVHVVYNDLPHGADTRTNLSYTHSKDGCEWSEPEVWHEGDYIYLKDLNMVDGELTALVVRSDSFDPTKGNRELLKITANGEEFISDINHNYTTGALSSSGEVLSPIGHTNYAGGEFLDMPYVNYIRRIHGSDDYVASEGISAEYESDAWLVKIEK